MREGTAPAVAALAGCATKMPQTAEEFRTMAPGAFMIQVQSFEVMRSTREVERAGLHTCRRRGA